MLQPLAVRVAAVVIAVVLVAGVLAAVVVSRRQGDAVVAAVAPRTVEVTPASNPAPGSSDLERGLPALLRFAQSARGLAFIRPVRVTLLDDAAFRARLRADNEEDEEEDKDELRATQRVLEGLGLLEKGVDLEKALESLYGDAVAGFYDTEDDDLVVRGDDLDPYVRSTLVHELVHALQDQHFDIERTDLDDRDDESFQGLAGLVEGDARRVERLYTDSLPLAEQKEAERLEASLGAGVGAGIPRVLLQLVAFPYIVGPDFASAVFDQGGQARLDAAFASPPSTTEHLLHPERFLSGESAVVVETPKADGEAIDQGVLGELGLVLLLGGGLHQRAATGWGGDRYIAWSAGDETCVRTTVVMDSLQDDAELRRALDNLARSRKGLEVTGKGPITFTSCG